jgi:hypothetical protein
MRFVSRMGTTTYKSDDDKIKLLKDTINYISNNTNTTDQFRQFKGAIDDVKSVLRFPFDRDKVMRLASEAINLWNFARKSDLTNHVSLLRQIIDLFKNHPDDVWIKDEENGLHTPCKIEHTPRDEYFRKHEHLTTRPHEPYAPEPAAAESAHAVPLAALLCELHELSERDI